MNPLNEKQPTAKQELERLSPLLSSLPKREVTMPGAGYFDGLASHAICTAKTSKAPAKTINLWYAAASMAVAASIALALVFWPTATTTTRVPGAIALDGLSDQELLEMALMDDAMVSASLLEGDSMIFYLASNEAFQYMLPETDENDNYNKLLLEMIDNEMLMEEWL